MNATTPDSMEQVNLFHDTGTDRAARTRGSMLWGAYGDALGFISELVDEKGLRRRTKGAALDRLMPWSRRVGGRGGVTVQLPVGCWSDDTQLRTAVSRSITNHGFDVDTFARVELPVWPSYALGGGRASKAAAKNLATHSTLWYANKFEGWHDAGGNGAAMRIQPHVWASPDLEEAYLPDVISDSICTHSHPRAIVGACFHAATLAHCLRTGSPPTLDECSQIARKLDGTLSLFKSHQNLSSDWISIWEQSTNKTLLDQWKTTVSELCKAIDQTSTTINCGEDLADVYQALCKKLDLYAEHQKGSGILTPVAAAALATVAPEPHEGMVVAANELGTDTDTIATMAGALLGACHPGKHPLEELLDDSYLLNEADRLTAISQGIETDNHQYPDVLEWVAPQTQADALVTDNGQLAVEGLGPVKELDEEMLWSPRKDFAWQWVQTDFGQTLIIKRRPEVRSRKTGNTLEPPPATAAPSDRTPETNGQTSRQKNLPLDRGLNIDRAVKHVLEHIDDNSTLGYTVRRTARDGTIQDLIALVASIRDELRR
ncbi:MAG: ADP-ribosylglycohydrolase family protein [Acidimicrobiia bacterium]|nr:ADP-ribosylglycohydrolase family protein [Acidimicrobiia bacterium]MCY4456421.1 ADP-ribosylglycohydrolase family protein [Acidimicrobiaceae bacterium]